jgi:cysteinyl-tRNA synthetase
MLKIYNTLTRKKEEFKPFKDDLVTFYHCGPTVYWTQHIGNLRAVVLNDLIVRTLEYLGYDVKLVRNYTDVGHLTSDEDDGEDKLEKGAKRENLTPQEVADKYIKIFESDIKDLNMRPADVKARATEHIKDMQAMIQTLLDKGFAYQTELAIYFDVSKAKNYTKLSGQNLEKNRAGAGEGEVSDPDKKNPADFALWFFKTGKHKNALQTWESPWGSPTDKADGQGFPGWHIECSAMAKKYLGDTIDIHMGGIEHIPVHHTNEIAQSESANGAKFVNYWLHNEHLTVNGEKMAKSTGTTYSLAELKAKDYEPLALRYFYLGAHYRSKQNFTWEALAAATTALQKLRNEILEIKKILPETSEAKCSEKYRERFASAISDDCNIPQALAVLWEVIKDDNLVNEEKYATIIDFDKIFGLKLNELKPEKTHIPPEIQALIDNRNKFRELGDFEQADAVRQEIENAGYAVEDTPTGPKISKK